MCMSGHRMEELRLLDIEVGKERMKGQKILEFFKKQEGGILK